MQGSHAPFTHVGLNYYRDGNDSVAPHNDKLSTLIDGHPIALVSLGSPRRMEIREKLPPRRVVRIDLEPGSLLVMSHAMQHHYDHGVPKTKHAVGPAHQPGVPRAAAEGFGRMTRRSGSADLRCTAAASRRGSPRA